MANTLAVDADLGYRGTVADVPSIKDFLFPVLRVLADAGAPLAKREYTERTADLMRLSSEQREDRIPSGKVTTYSHRAGWATNELKHAGLVFSPELGMWSLTEEGRAFMIEHRDGLSPEGIQQLRRRAKAGMRAVAADDDEGAGEHVIEPVADNAISPVEQIQQALATLNDAVAAELLQRLGQADPAFFERTVLRLLLAMRYGASQDDLRHMGGTGDGGIDGIISLDRLGLQKVYVQAKRWQSNVGRPEIQAFFGALAGRRANKGVFITTGGFTRDAKDFADSVSDSLVLVSGRELARLMIEFGVGVTRRPEYVPEIDSDFFIED